VLTLLVLASALQTAAAPVPIGVGAVREGRSPCVSLPSVRLQPGELLTLVRANQPQIAIAAAVARPVETCEELSRALIDGPYYEVTARSAVGSDPGVWVVLRGRLETRSVRGSLRIRLNARYPRSRVQVCTSSEGLHLTMWTNTPLRSLRLWHQYFYLGYDVEPTCRDQEG
jgi:hypothetical protein